MFEFEPPKPPKIKRSKVFGRPEQPLGRCKRCKKYFPPTELQKFMPTPSESYWLCPKCFWKRRMKEKFSSSLLSRR